MTRATRKRKYLKAQKERRQLKAEDLAVLSLHDETSRDGTKYENLKKAPGELDMKIAFLMQHMHQQIQRNHLSVFEDTSLDLPLPKTELDISKPIRSARDRGLCDSCARFNWRYHLLDFGLGEPPANGQVLHEDDDTKIMIGKYGGQFEFNGWSTTVHLPRLATIFANSEVCTFCSLIVSTLKAQATADEIEKVLRDHEPVECTFFGPYKSSTREDESALHVGLCSDKKAHGGRYTMSSWTVIELKFAFHEMYDGYVEDLGLDMPFLCSARKQLKPSQIDHQIIEKWWSDCTSSSGQHSDKKGYRFGTDSEEEKEENQDQVVNEQPTNRHEADTSISWKVVDVETNRIIQAPVGCRYVALSYVWGDSDCYKPSRGDKMTEILEGGVEQEYIPLSGRQLPQTIQDAIEVVKLVNERYLWIDVLSIVQDDEGEKMKAIQCMDQIYRSAVLTIVAASGKDADTGLQGFHPSSRNIQSLPGTIEGVGLLRIDPGPKIKQSPWSARAWTYQEEQLSDRVLIFANDRVYFQCKHGSFGEARPNQQLPDSLLCRVLNSRDGTFAHVEDYGFDEYTRHVKNYTLRNLKYDHDILNAFEGIMSDIQRRYGGMNFWGLPAHHLLFALSWRSSPQRFPLKRRAGGSKFPNGLTPPGIDPTRHTDRKLVPFPSWSWTGWVGPVHYTWFDSLSERVFREAPEDIPNREYYANKHYGLQSDLSYPMDEVPDKDDIPLQMKMSIYNGTLQVSTTMGTIEHERVKQWSWHTLDDDDSEGCRGTKWTRTRELVMDDGTPWTTGSKTAIQLHSLMIDDPDECSVTVLLVKEDEESGFWYREGVLDLQPREWEAGNPERRTLILA